MDQPTSSQNVHPHEPGSEVPTRTTVTPAGAQPTWNDSFSQLDSYAEQLRVKLPAAPPGLLNFYMSWVPWIAIVFGVLFVVLSLIGLVASTLFSVLGFMFGAPGIGLVVSSIITLIGSVLVLVGGLLMLQRKVTGWWLLAVGLVVGILNSLFHVSILFLIVDLLIAYVHLQVKPNYRET
jgi:hypothetical protein